MLVSRSVQFLLFSTLALSQQIPLGRPHDDSSSSRAQGSPKIAIIGAGVAGISVLEHLHKRADYTHDITLFEKEDHIGGRVNTRHFNFSWGRQNLDSGATWFSIEDACILDMAAGHGSFIMSYKVNDVLSCVLDTDGWFAYLNCLWKYGYAANRARAAIQKANAAWKRFLQEPADEPFEADLQKAFDSAGLEDSVLISAKLWLDNQTLPTPMLEDIFYPSLQARAYQNDSMTALSMILATRRQESILRLAGGISGVVDGAVEQFRPELKLRSKVASIGPGTHRRYRVTYHEIDWLYIGEEQHAEFDIVVLATPLSISDIDINIPAVDVQPLTYTSRFVTYFESPLPISRDLEDKFSYVVSDQKWVGVLGTRDKNHITLSLEPRESLNYGNDGFGNLSHSDPELLSFVPPERIRDQKLYRVVSEEPLRLEEMAALLDQHAYNTPPGRLPHLYDEYSLGGISFNTRSFWKHAFPTLSPEEGRVHIPKSAELAEGLFYASALEHVTSSMEMSCRMGRHVARDISRRAWE